MKKNTQKEGFVILYAVIITTVVLVVGVSLMNIITKQLFLSSISRSSKVAYYAALSGRNCAEFWRTITDEDGGRKYFINGNFSSDIECLGSKDLGSKPINKLKTETGDNGSVITSFEFDIDINDSQKACSVVTVTYDESQCPQNQTLVSSEGYNVSCAKLDDDSLPPRLVRSIYRDRVAVSGSCSANRPNADQFR